MDLGKLTDVQMKALAKEVLGEMSNDDVLEVVIAWAKESDYAEELAAQLDVE